MQLGQIEAFLETARHGNISRAAASLYLTQPTVTSRLQALEAEVGQPLFTRARYGVALTDAGKTLLPYAERALEALRDGAAALRSLRDASEGNLYVGSSSLISAYFLPDVLERFASEHPRVRVVVRTGHTEDVLRDVLREDVQIGITHELRHPDIESRRVYVDELVLAVHPSHPFTQRPDVTARDIAGEVLVLVNGSSHVRRIMQIFVEANLVPRVRFEVDNVEAAKKIVERGLGIAIVHSLSIGRELETGTLRAVPIAADSRERRGIAVIYRKIGGLGGIARAFLGTIEQIYPSPSTGESSRLKGVAIQQGNR